MTGKGDTSKKDEGGLRAPGKRKKAAAASSKPKRPPSDEASGKPKRPPSALAIFFTEFRQEYNPQHPDDKSDLALMKAAAGKWRDMSKQEKQPYVDQTNQKKKQYYQVNKPKCPPSPFKVFRTEFRQEYDAQHPDNKSDLVATKAAAEKWLDMSEQEKQPYVDQANQKKQYFEVDDEDDEENDDDE